MTDTTATTSAIIGSSSGLPALMADAARDPAVAADLNAAFGQWSHSPFVSVVAALLTAAAAKDGFNADPETIGMLSLVAVGIGGYAWSIVTRRMSKKTLEGTMS